VGQRILRDRGVQWHLTRLKNSESPDSVGDQWQWTA
jgi:hypothetical protein